MRSLSSATGGPNTRVLRYPGSSWHPPCQVAATPKSDVDELRDLLVWARKERIVLGQVSIGMATVTVLDLGVHRDVKPATSDRARVQDIRRQFAGAAADKFAEAGLLDPDDDDEAAVP